MKSLLGALKAKRAFCIADNGFGNFIFHLLRALPLQTAVMVMPVTSGLGAVIFNSTV